jgi:proteasome lid subunit RPN8/RPN11
MSDDFFDGEWELADVNTNRDDVDVNVSISVSGFEVGSAGSADPSTADPSTTGPTAPPTPTGTFRFPRDSAQLMQSLEVRGKNGHHEVVETVYVLLVFGHRPPRLVALDDPEMYDSATPTSVHYYLEPMAQEVARQCGDHTPDAIVKLHTHPNGSTTPSAKDKTGTEVVKQTFEKAVGSQSATFLQGIHAYEPVTVSPDAMRDPTAAGNRVSWNGERYRHTLALFDAHFGNGPEVQLV